MGRNSTASVYQGRPERVLRKDLAHQCVGAPSAQDAPRHTRTSESCSRRSIGRPSEARRVGQMARSRCRAAAPLHRMNGLEREQGDLLKWDFHRLRYLLLCESRTLRDRRRSCHASSCAGWWASSSYKSAVRIIPACGQWVDRVLHRLVVDGHGPGGARLTHLLTRSQERVHYAGWLRATRPRTA